MQACSSIAAPAIHLLSCCRRPYPAHLARHIIDNTLQSMDMEVVYSHGWEGDQGGGQLSAASDPTKYEEAYNTTVWDEMLQVYTAMFHWIGC